MYELRDDVLHPFIGNGNSQPNRRQDLPPLYRLNGAVYVTSRPVVMSGRIMGETVRPFVMGPEESVDIDDEWDFKLAEWLLEHRPV
jgi:N-acylneuraminate cytidylyltransferase/CMP-N,N'-diacetyllegionaminic acid synthase